MVRGGKVFERLDSSTRVGLAAQLRRATPQEHLRPEDTKHRPPNPHGMKRRRSETSIPGNIGEQLRGRRFVLFRFVLSSFEWGLRLFRFSKFLYAF